MLREASSRFVSVERGDDAIIRAVFCADPRPIKVSWRWSSFQLEAGSGSGRFVAEALHKVTPAPYLHQPPTVESIESFDLDEASSTTDSNEPAEVATALSTGEPSVDETPPVAAALVAPPFNRLPAKFTYSVRTELDKILHTLLYWLRKRLVLFHSRILEMDKLTCC